MPEKLRADSALMSEEVFSATCEYLKTTYPDTDINIRWVGGEPLLVPLRWYEMTEKYLRTLTTNTSEMMQTSMLYLTEDWMEFVSARLKNRIYTSYDPYSRHLNNSFKQYLEIWENKHQLAKAYDVDVRVVTTVTPEILNVNVNELISDMLQLNIDALTFVRFVNTDASRGYVTRPQFSNFLITIFDYCMAFNTSLSISTIADAIRAVVFEKPHGIWEPQNCLINRSTAINSNGDILNCTYEHLKIGNVFDKLKTRHVSNVLQSCSKKAIQAKLDCFECKTCDFNTWCHIKCYTRDIASDIDASECLRYSSFLKHVQTYCSSEIGYLKALTYLKMVEERITDKNAAFS